MSNQVIFTYDHGGTDEAIIQGPKGHRLRIIHQCFGDDCLTCFMAAQGYRVSYMGFWFKPYDMKAEQLSDKDAIKWKLQIPDQLGLFEVEE